MGVGIGSLRQIFSLYSLMTVSFVMTVLSFLAIGQLCGRLMERRKKLHAYAEFTRQFIRCTFDAPGWLSVGAAGCMVRTRIARDFGFTVLMYTSNGMLYPRLFVGLGTHGEGVATSTFQWKLRRELIRAERISCCHGVGAMKSRGHRSGMRRRWKQSFHRLGICLARKEGFAREAPGINLELV